MTNETPKYRLHGATTTAAGGIVLAGEIIEFTGIPNDRMEPLNDAAWAAVESAGHIDTARKLARNSALGGANN